MSHRFKRNVKNLQKLYKSTNQTKRKLIGNASPDLIGAICDCASNIKKGNVPLTTKHFNQLKKYQKHINTLTTKVSQKKKKHILQQGGFLGTLLKPIAQLLLGGLLPK